MSCTLCESCYGRVVAKLICYIAETGSVCQLRATTVVSNTSRQCTRICL
jgi:hypothetical protein